MLKFVYGLLGAIFILGSVEAGHHKHKDNCHPKKDSCHEKNRGFKTIIAFGDSLTDVGNVAGITIPGNAPLINGYFEETHFSDNVIWIEQVAAFLKLPTPTPGRGPVTSLPPLTNGSDWAWGGAEADPGFIDLPSTTEPVPNLLTQVESYLAANKADPNNLYSIWAGADNFLEGDHNPVEAVDAVVQAIRLLYIGGARHFLVFNLPQLGDTPAAIAGGPAVEIAAELYSVTFNKLLKNALFEISQDRRFKGNFYFVDIFTEFVIAIDTVRLGGTYTPSFFVPGPPVAISNVTGLGLIFFQTTGTFPTNFLFWDGVHPTTQGHQVVAGLVLQALKHKGSSSLCAASAELLSVE